eukprot:TRINITY_DN7071_c1_g1_i2.p1 TRINITY_DN7071_c1_g1~~TRINITY_DN7071_c1_g1_i2.p1  ORF type:complete len:463 (-),score=126.05 TRINITY_DN7071_c1_g1_i2:214-1560(-)
MASILWRRLRPKGVREGGWPQLCSSLTDRLSLHSTLAGFPPPVSDIFAEPSGSPSSLRQVKQFSSFDFQIAAPKALQSKSLTLQQNLEKIGRNPRMASWPRGRREDGLPVVDFDPAKLNAVFLTGYVSKSVEFIEGPEGQVHASTFLAVKRGNARKRIVKRGKEEEENEEERQQQLFEWVCLELRDDWGPFALEHLKIGDMIYIAGKLRIVEWEESGLIQSGVNVLVHDLKLVIDPEKEQEDSRKQEEGDQGATNELLQQNLFDAGRAGGGSDNAVMMDEVGAAAAAGESVRQGHGSGTNADYWRMNAARDVTNIQQDLPQSDSFQGPKDVDDSAVSPSLQFGTRDADAMAGGASAVQEARWKHEQQQQEGVKEMDTEQLWQLFFLDPSNFWDNRNDKRNRNAPDFVHKATRKGLWLGRSTPLWVAQELELHDSAMEAINRSAIDSRG